MAEEHVSSQPELPLRSGTSLPWIEAIRRIAPILKLPDDLVYRATISSESSFVVIQEIFQQLDDTIYDIDAAFKQMIFIAWTYVSRNDEQLIDYNVIYRPTRLTDIFVQERDTHIQMMLRLIRESAIYTDSILLLDHRIGYAQTLDLVDNLQMTFVVVYTLAPSLKLGSSNDFIPVSDMEWDEHRQLYGIIGELQYLPFRVRVLRITNPNTEPLWIVTNDLSQNVTAPELDTIIQEVTAKANRTSYQLLLDYETNSDHRPVSRIRPRLQRIILTVIVIAILVAELLLTQFGSFAGMIVHIGVMIAMLLIAGAYWTQYFAQMMMVLTFIPLTRVVNIGFSTIIPEQPEIFIFTSLTMFACLAVTRNNLDMTWRDAGIKLDGLITQLFIAALGIPLGILAYGLLSPEQTITTLSGIEFWSNALTLILFTGVVDELLFRGIFQRVFKAYLGGFWAILFTTALTSLLYTSPHQPATLLIALIFGLIFGVIRQRTDSVMGVGLAHGIANVIAFLYLPTFLG